ncbi:uncharacterized protein TDEL_0E00280 [Torulaspora delbrueckii]|uniref:Uncharacterized protein n=1 Tax=Torulaspora delbrueckii TaxID=4950 RepID=G8ZUH7_TORDE|nr:hypothetical protein TDEL_0E00280 [Torulaspora delbrueckii]CCE92271.1 hypothetical protein TDEL_0E00280 [Torulaspora delbrueckii]
MPPQKKKLVFITGASAGIGYALAVEFAKRGTYKVYAGARSVDKLKTLEQYGVIAIAFDITNSESIIKARDLITKETDGGLDILYNNVGVASKDSIFDISLKEYRKIFDTNFFGHIEVLQAFQHLLLKSKGLVAFTDSVIDLAPIPFASAYFTSKAAFHGLGEAFALETNSLGIKVLQVRTGRVASDISEGVNPQVSPNSVYYLEDENIFAGAFDDASPSEIYAKDVVNDVERSIRKGTLYAVTYRGKMASTAAYLNWLPFWIWSKVILRFLGINGAFAKIAAKLNKPKLRDGI